MKKGIKYVYAVNYSGEIKEVELVNDEIIVKDNVYEFSLINTKFNQYVISKMYTLIGKL